MRLHFRHDYRRYRLGLTVALAGAAIAITCGGRSGTPPIAPTAISAPSPPTVDPISPLAPRTVPWNCLAETAPHGSLSVVADSDCTEAPVAVRFGTRLFVGPPAPPLAPTNLTFAVTGNTIVLSWFEPCRGRVAPDCVSGEPQSYIIEAGSTAGAANLANFDTGTAAISLSAPNVPNGTYFVRVRARNAFGTSAPTADATIRVGSATCGSAPGAPNTLAAAVDGTTMNLSWNAPGQGCAATNYVVEAGSTAGASNIGSLTTGSSATTLSLSAAVGTYFVRVRAQNGDGISGPSNEVRVVIGTACVAPGPPQQLTYSTTSATTGTVLSLGWQVPATGTSPFTYILEAGTATGGTNVFVGNVGANTSLNSAVPDGPYFIRVRAVNACGTSTASNEVSFRAGAAPLVWSNLAYPGGIIAVPAGVLGAGGAPLPSLCVPAPASVTALCQPTGAAGANDPSGGQAPYRFQKPTGGRFPPFGLTLQLNGLLTGTAAAGGFEVEVVDLAGNPADQTPRVGSLQSVMFRQPGLVTAAVSASKTFTVVVNSTPSCTAAPNAPTGLSATVSGTSLVLGWTAPTGTQTPTSYLVEIGTSSGSSNTRSTNTGSTTTSYTASSLSNGTYYVRVRAVNSCGTGTASTEATATIGSTTTPLAFAITSASCTFSRQTGAFDYEYSVAVAGTGGGPVGARLVLPSLSGYIRQSWSSSWGTGTTDVEDRSSSQPATTSWTATLVVGRSPGASVTVSGYVRNSENTQRVTDQRTLTCQ